MSQAAVFRRLIRELRHIHKKGPVKNTPAYTYILDQYHNHRVTGAKHCKERDEMAHLAQTYLCLLESNKKQAELSARFSKGEKSIVDSAAAVGLSLPKTYEPK